MSERHGISIGMWVGIVAGAAAVFFLLNVLANNSPPPAPAEQPHLYTQLGPFVKETINIKAGGHKALRIDLNRPARIRGGYLAPDRNTHIGFFVFTEENYRKWQIDRDPEHREISTGYVWQGSFDHRVDPQAYYIVFDNAENPDRDVNVDVLINLERP